MAKKNRRAEESRGGPGPWFYGILAAVVVGGGAFLLLGGGDGDAGGVRPLPASVGNVEADSGAGVALGREDAPVTIMEFANYQCPHCAQFGTFSGRLLRQNYVEGGGPVRWVLYDYLLDFPYEIPAALAARCAAEQGRHWEMHDLLLSRQGDWSGTSNPRSDFRSYAEEIGLDMGQYDACMEERRPLERIVAAHKYGAQLGVRGTPTLFLNGRRLDPQTEGGYEAIERLIRAAVDSADAAGDTVPLESAPAQAGAG